MKEAYSRFASSVVQLKEVHIKTSFYGEGSCQDVVVGDVVIFIAKGTIWYFLAT